MQKVLLPMERREVAKAITQNPRVFATRLMEELHPDYGTSPCRKSKKDQMTLHVLAGRAFQRAGAADIREYVRASEEFKFAAGIAMELTDNNPHSRYAPLAAKYLKLAADVWCDTCLLILTEHKGMGARWHGDLSWYWFNSGGQKLYEETADAYMFVANAKKHPGVCEHFFFKAALCFLRARRFSEAKATLTKALECSQRKEALEARFKEAYLFEEAKIRVESLQEEGRAHWKRGGVPLRSVVIYANGPASEVDSLPALPKVTH